MLTFLIVCAGNEPKDKGRTIMEENLKIPAHVALILDGNGRWAKKRGLPRQLGHKKGCETLEQVVEDAARLGIRYLTVYGFSTENWKRPEDEVSGIFKIMVNILSFLIYNLKLIALKYTTYISQQIYIICIS